MSHMFLWFCVAYLMHVTLCDISDQGQDSTSCGITVTIPHEYIKDSCGDNQNTNSKMRSLEVQLSQLKQEIDELTAKMEYTSTTVPAMLQDSAVTNKYSNKGTGQGFRTKHRPTKRLLKPETYIPKKRLVRIMKPLIAKEVSAMKAVLREEIKNELLQDLTSIVKNSNITRAHITDSLSKNVTMIPENKNRNPAQQATGIKAKPSNKHLHKIPKEAKYASQDNKNDLPRSDSNAQAQSDSQIISETVEFLSFQREVRTHIHEHIMKIKMMETYQSENEKKMEKIIQTIEETKASLDEQLSKRYEVSKLNELTGQVEDLQKDISLFTTGISSMIHTQFHQNQLNMEQHIDEKIKQSNVTIQLLREDMRSHRISQKRNQNFIANMRVKVNQLELDIAEAMGHIQTINETLHPLVRNDIEKGGDAQDIEINKTLQFVQQMQEIWPSVLGTLETLTSSIALQQSNHSDTSVLESNLTSVTKKVDEFYSTQTVLTEQIKTIRQDIDTIQQSYTDIEDKHMNCNLEQRKWVKYDFNKTEGKSTCRGQKFVKRTRYYVGVYVGVQLCSPVRYKIYLSDSLEDKFLDIGDIDGSGEDHCEFVGAHRNRYIKVGPSATRNHNRRTPCYKRSHWGQVPTKGTLNFFNPTVPWYECGIVIPD